MTESQKEPLWRTGLTTSQGGGGSGKFGSFHLQQNQEPSAASLRLTVVRSALISLKERGSQLCISSNWFLIFFFFKESRSTHRPTFYLSEMKSPFHSEDWGKNIKKQYHA